MAMLLGTYVEIALRRTPLAKPPVWLLNRAGAALDAASRAAARPRARLADRELPRGRDCGAVSRLHWRRLATAVGLYSGLAFGVLATIVAARSFSLHEFGLYATVLAAAGFFQALLDLTVEESLTKYGFRYATAGQWGRLRRLFRRTLELKLVGGLLASVAMLALAPIADRVFGTEGLTVPFLIAAALPLAQAPENVATTALLLRGRYDFRAGYQSFAMALRLAAVVIGVGYGISATIAAIVLAQLVSTAAVAVVGIAAFRRFPQEPAAALTEDRKAIITFVLQSSAATGLISLRTALAPLLLGIVSGPVQVGLFRIAQAPQTGFNAASAPVRLILLTEQTRDWEQGRHERVLAGVRRYTLTAIALDIVLVPLFWWLMPRLIELVFEPRYLPATDAARVILVAAAIQLTVGWTKSFPTTIGRPGLRLLTARHRDGGAPAARARARAGVGRDRCRLCTPHRGHRLRARMGGALRPDQPGAQDVLVDVDRPLGHARDRELRPGPLEAGGARGGSAARRHRAASSSSRATPSTSPGSTSAPVSPSTTTSGTALTRVATTGQPGEHRLEQHDPEPLPARRVHEHVCALEPVADLDAGPAGAPRRRDRARATSARVSRFERPGAEDREPRVRDAAARTARTRAAASRDPSARSGGRSASSERRRRRDAGLRRCHLGRRGRAARRGRSGSSSSFRAS